MVLSCRPTRTEVLSQVMQQLLVKKWSKNMVIFRFRCCVRSFTTLTQLLLTAALLAHVDLDLVKVSHMAVSKSPHLDASLHRLQRHVLLQGGATCELYHRFVNCYLLVWIVEG